MADRTSYELYAGVPGAEDYHDYCRTCWRTGPRPSSSKDGPMVDEESESSSTDDAEEVLEGDKSSGDVQRS
eukprot:5247328-Karenia_brevis.AAC.1